MELGEEKTALSCRSSDRWDPGLHFWKRWVCSLEVGRVAFWRRNGLGLSFGAWLLWEWHGRMLRSHRRAQRIWWLHSSLLDSLPALQWQESSNAWFWDPFQVRASIFHLGLKVRWLGLRFARQRAKRAVLWPQLLFLPTNMAVEMVTCWRRDEQGRARSSFWGCEAWPAGHRALIRWVTAGWCDPGAGSGLSSQTFLILVAFWWRQFLGCGVLHIGSVRVVLDSQWVSDWRGRSSPFLAALGAVLKSPSRCLFLWPCLDFCEPLNSPQWISFCSKPAREDSGFCNWTLTDTVNYINGFLNTEQFCITGMNSTWVECVLLKHYSSYIC